MSAPALTDRDAVTRRAAMLLRDLAGRDAKLRADQVEAVTALVCERRRVLVVQRTGWGKSAVYFLATRLLREAGAGPTLLISPLLALMRDQVSAARVIGVAAESIDSTNREAWDDISERVRDGAVDLLLVSPERLSHPQFRTEVLEPLAGTVGMVVVDEAHCISDWGHDFRPDYRRITDLLARLADDTPVLATTATANDRVVADVTTQLGADPLTLRGTLDRTSLALSVVLLDSAAERLAWLAEWVPTTAGSGIVYCLTVADTERVAAWLRSCGVDAVAYSGATAPEERRRIEDALAGNAVKAVCATTALGMGYDKPDLAFVCHYGSPDSPITYYQAVGRAGRAVDHADAVLLPGSGDERVWAHFARMSLPSASEAAQVLDALEAAGGPISTVALEPRVNLRRSRLEQILKILDVEGACERSAQGWSATGHGWHPDPQRVARVHRARAAEADAMRAYATTDQCLMLTLRRQLDDDGVPCGRCSSCTGIAPGPPEPSPELVAAARGRLRSEDVVLAPRKQWPKQTGVRSGRIGDELRHEPGRALALGRDGGWDRALTTLLTGGGDPRDPEAERARTAAFDEVVRGLVAVLARWEWPARPTWVTWVPSRTRGGLVTALAEELARLGRLELVAAVHRAEDTPAQRTLRNSSQQAAAAARAFAADGPMPSGPCLLVDDVTHSGWTLAAVAAALREAGADAVLPLVLHRDP